MSEIHITRAVYQDTKETVSIDAVESGLQDNVVCACCGGKLIANKGQKKAWYFSHYFDEACVLAYETQLHLTAKEYFARVGKIPMPLEAGWVSPDVCAELKISAVQTEVYMDGRRPDLVVEVGSEQYWIEIANKHKCDASKVWDCRTHDKNVIEIDVSDCGHLDQFNSLQHCLVRIQSLNVCNDYLDEIASHTANKHETVRKQFEALMRSQKQLEENKFEQEKAEKSLEERLVTKQKKYEEHLEKMKLRESAQDEILAELERAIDVHKEHLCELETRKANLEIELNERSRLKLAELEERNKVTLEQLKAEFEVQWQQELISKREQFEHEMSEEFQRRFQIQSDIINAKKRAYEKYDSEIKILEHETVFLRAELEELVINKALIQQEQAKQIEQQIKPLIEQRNALLAEVTQLTSMVEEKLVEADLIDTYANNIAEVREFCLARSDYRHVLNQRVQKLNDIERRYTNLCDEYEEKYAKLDVMVKLANDFCNTFKQVIDISKQKEILSCFPEQLVQRINTRLIQRPRNAQEEIEDFERRSV
ncbi:hypothetical protein CGT94_10345 [Vibrio metoecus]|uniref:competence protein CoiA family protein n=1 Tax=Vibrio metoecus TaxID=1481663 RepID=UPI0006D86214|nr:competence protein CoiA family protein [Vibrio metoecus]EJL6320115.1 hypothetical protein [Vibrio cholerae]KQB05718.1 hypothetical protein XV93_11050 [Vibrio metoecus]PAR50061.1 hypothetical protein CGT94_10345 [Vibrio metoecus]